MEMSELIGLMIMSSICGLLGNYFFIVFQRRMNYTSKQMNILLLILLSFIPIYALLGFMSDHLGIRTKAEMFVVGCYYGFLIG